ncbi:Uncharacterized protein HZ326_19357 [Fusarium oxysporum f. sp. albedinis]|nr:Uncharacterized protein HZ326_19357 [Fusarium oxysporum f. sp. albedinis]
MGSHGSCHGLVLLCLPWPRIPRETKSSANLLGEQKHGEPAALCKGEPIESTIVEKRPTRLFSRLTLTILNILEKGYLESKGGGWSGKDTSHSSSHSIETASLTTRTVRGWGSDYHPLDGFALFTFDFMVSMLVANNQKDNHTRKWEDINVLKEALTQCSSQEFVYVYIKHSSARESEFPEKLSQPGTVSIRRETEQETTHSESKLCHNACIDVHPDLWLRIEPFHRSPDAQCQSFHVMNKRIRQTLHPQSFVPRNAQ